VNGKRLNWRPGWYMTFNCPTVQVCILATECRLFVQR
jgi:hypothetical protein